VIFAASYLPMLVKLVRTKDLASYSGSSLVLTNLGNAVHSFYVFSLPAGPIWALHSFYLGVQHPDDGLVPAVSRRQRRAPRASRLVERNPSGEEHEHRARDAGHAPATRGRLSQERAAVARVPRKRYQTIASAPGSRRTASSCPTPRFPPG
jgi:hypothetical protein